jgi:hypothetical protein
MTCCLCGRFIQGHGHNPEPLASHPERCCDDCNATKVIPARLSGMHVSGVRCPACHEVGGHLPGCRMAGQLDLRPMPGDCTCPGRPGPGWRWNPDCPAHPPVGHLGEHVVRPILGDEASVLGKIPSWLWAEAQDDVEPIPGGLHRDTVIAYIDAADDTDDVEWLRATVALLGGQLLGQLDGSHVSGGRDKCSECGAVYGAHWHYCSRFEHEQVVVRPVSGEGWREGPEEGRCIHGRPLGEPCDQGPPCTVGIGVGPVDVRPISSVDAVLSDALDRLTSGKDIGPTAIINALSQAQREIASLRQLDVSGLSGDLSTLTGEQVNIAYEERIADLEAEIERLRATLRGIRELHQPVWASEQAKAAGKEPWVCQLCGTADGHWPCDTLTDIREVLGDA